MSDLETFRCIAEIAESYNQRHEPLEAGDAYRLALSAPVALREIERLHGLVERAFNEGRELNVSETGLHFNYETFADWAAAREEQKDG